MNYLIGYIIGINLLGIVLIWLKVKTEIIKLSENMMKLIILIFSLIGGVIGIFLGIEMTGYNKDSKLIKKIIPMMIFIEMIIGLYLFYQHNM